MSFDINQKITQLKEQIGSKSVLCALSGGVDSTVTATLVGKAVGQQLTCVLVDTGLMRLHECDETEAVFKNELGIKLIRVNAEERFLGKLAGVTDPEQKRKIIGEEFIRVFEEEAKKIGHVDFLAQGTIYPDIVESGKEGTNGGRTIKSHHNVGGLPDVIDFEGLVEPLRDLYKNEVRELGEALGLPEKLVWRQPFPGPGLAIRCLGEVTKEKLDLLREADAIFRAEIASAGLDRSINQYFAIMTDMKSVGARSGERTYDHVIVLRGVTTTDFMEADWAKIPHEVLAKVSQRIVTEVAHINRVAYDITQKPPATIEWE